MFSKVTVVDDEDRELFIGGGPGPMESWSWRRQVKDTSGVAILDLRHHGAAMKNLWTVEDPDGHLMADLKHVSGGRRSDLDMVVASGKGEEDDIVLQIRQKDQSGITTQVFLKTPALLNCTFRSRTTSPISVKLIGVPGRFESLVVWILPL
jgi:hypothetical protein